MDQYSPERIADRMEIQDVMFKWCRAIDRLDYEGMLAVFHPDAVDEHGPYNGPVDGLVEWIRNRHVTIPFSSHQVSNMLIEFASPTVALAETYVRTLQRYPAEAAGALAQMMASGPKSEGHGIDMMTSSRYIDRFEKRGGRWKIAFRRLSQDWKQAFAVTAQTPQNNPDWLTQQRGSTDAVYQERDRLGIV
jgi:SnoaL-like protein